MKLKVKERQVDTVSILDFSGRIVLGKETALMRDSILDLVARGRKNIVLNLSDVPYIDSTGIGELLSASKAVRKAGGDLKLLNLTRKVRDMVEVVKLGSIFELFDDETAAVKSFAAEPKPGLARAS
ncbi:MAG TPA: STAS domain-containing protein [Terriglobales bacterium]|nr:STAS domain-containing protein [Terriglobales bacterium]